MNDVVCSGLLGSRQLLRRNIVAPFSRCHVSTQSMTRYSPRPRDSRQLRPEFVRELERHSLVFAARQRLAFGSGIEEQAATTVTTNFS